MEQALRALNKRTLVKKQFFLTTIFLNLCKDKIISKFTVKWTVQGSERIT